MFINNNPVFYQNRRKKIKKLGTNHSCSGTANVSACIRQERDVGSKLETESPCRMNDGQRKIPCWQVWGTWDSHSEESFEREVKKKEKEKEKAKKVKVIRFWEN